MEASHRLDGWLVDERGQMNPSNIYGAPRIVYAGARVSRDRILEYLSRASYADAARATSDRRGQFRMLGSNLEITPPRLPDGRANPSFQSVRISFGEGGRVVQAISDLASKEKLEACTLEPEPIATITRQLGEPSSSNERGLRYEVGYAQLPPQLVSAVVAIEDKRFFQHTGVDYLGLARALLRGLLSGERVGGTSTITQQLVKNILVGSERSYRRKFREAFLALALERRFSKEQIFSRYANAIYLGRRGSLSIYGFAAAAREYFGKDISRISLPEAAFLAGIIQRPAYYLSDAHRDDALARRDHVIDAMLRLEMIASDEAEKAKKTPLSIQSRARSGSSPVNAPYFIDHIQEQLAEVLPGEDLAEAGYRIFTTLDMDLQRAAAQAVSQGLAVLDREMSRRRPPIPADTVQGALVAMDTRTGEILAMVGGRDYGASQFNRATDAFRQPGSSIKPLVFEAALTMGEHEGRPITLANTYIDQPTEFEGGYAPGNFGEEYQYRPLTVREGLARSSNIVSVSLAHDTGYGRVADMIERFGLRRPPENAAIALGASEATPLQMASAFSAFASSGMRAVPLSINRIENDAGTKLHDQRPQTKEVVSAQESYLVLSAMRDAIAQPYGTGRAAAQMGSFALAGKTGTSQRSDAWFGAFSPRLVCVVWVGFDDHRMLRMTGSHAALPIWLSFMRQAAALRPDLFAGDFEKPEGLVELEIEPHTGLLASESCPEKRMEIFLPSRVVEEPCTESALLQASSTMRDEGEMPSPPESGPAPSRSEHQPGPRRRPAGITSPR